MWKTKLNQLFNIRYQRTGQTQNHQLSNNKKSLFYLFVLHSRHNSYLRVCLPFPFFPNLLLCCLCRTTRFGDLLLSWRCRIRAPTCWLQTVKERWRIGSTHSTKSCTAALRLLCRKRGTETFMMVCVCSHFSSEGTQIWDIILFSVSPVKIYPTSWKEMFFVCHGLV